MTKKHTDQTMQKTKPAGLHPRNKHRNGYDFKTLTRVNAHLTPYVRQNPAGRPTIDFANNRAVVELNKSLLMSDYGIDTWDIPKGYLCPPIPGRADYIHYLADLLMSTGIKRQQFDQVRALDIGTGANAVYPIIGMSEYGWSFTGSEVDPISLKNIEHLKNHNRLLDRLRVVAQLQRDKLFEGVIQPGEYFHLTLCNPPFHTSQQEAEQGAARKKANLSQKTVRTQTTGLLNFGGQATELWCPGGELGFVRRMIRESTQFADQVGWFTCLISKQEHLAPLRKALKALPVAEIRTVTMAQGQKVSRFLAWTFAAP